MLHEGFKRGGAYINPFAARASYSKSNWTLEMIRFCRLNNIPYTLVTYDTEGKWDADKYKDRLNG